MRLAITIALLTSLPVLGQPGVPPEENKKGITRVTEILNTLPKNLLIPDRRWTEDELIEASRHLKKVSPGHKMLVQMPLVSLKEGPAHLEIRGPLELQDYQKISFRGRDLIVRTFIHNQPYLAMPLSDKAKLEKARPGQVVKLLVTTALVTLDPANADIFFDGTRDKTELLEVLPIKE